MKVVFLTLLYAAYLFPSLCQAYDQADCIGCHREGAKGSLLQLSFQDFKTSIHAGEFGCKDCHKGVVDDSHRKGMGAGSVECGKCHDQEILHGRGSKKKALPRCHDCHSRHEIRAKDDPRSTVHPLNLKRTCQGCHPEESGGRDFLSWLPSLRVAFHGKQDFNGPYDMGNCIGCHQGKAAHGGEERLSEDNCDRCHFKDAEGTSALSGFMHPRTDAEKQPLVFVSGLIYQGGVWVLVLAGIRSFSRLRSKYTK